ncbi:MAG: GxxExxY protein [Tepidisphaeraceae bacterium]
MNEITEAVIGCAYRVGNELGVGYLEKVYENALFVDLSMSGLRGEQQRSIIVKYRGAVVGEYVADLLVESLVIVEVKHVRALEDVHTAQCLNYLKATGLKVCLLINFGKSKIEIKRLVHNF